MNRQIKFRAWCPDEWIEPVMLDWEALKEADNDDLCWCLCDVFEGYLGMIGMQFTGLQDANNTDIYVGDICIFDNGDTFIVRIERWLQCYGEWIGEPECEDQLRDFYRVEKSIVMGNIHQHKHLLEL